ncbi:hypothetical protein HS7_10910 [Sulfolobales archaeon HS-7]|nr:hypothetical protein HS7_10910 [Sulfolobales archaeon HS-7]
MFANPFMLLTDYVYGSVNVDENVIIDLLNSKTVQRLKHISQQGLPKILLDNQTYFTRYEHSIGVFILVRKLGGELEEQIAGLLHDVSHMAFSHTMDMIFGDYSTQNFQDSIHAQFLSNSDAGQVLRNYGFDPEKISDLSRFPLVDLEIPNLCADRADHLYREIILRGEEANWDKIINHNGYMAFYDESDALEFANKYLEMQRKVWGNWEETARRYIFAGIIKQALDSGILSTEDLFATEEQVMDKVMGIEEFKEKIQLLNRKIRVEDNGEVKLRIKKRYVDPLVVTNGTVKRLSELNNDFAEALERFKREPYERNVKIFFE